MSAPAWPPEGSIPSRGEVIAQRSEGTHVLAPARPPEGSASPALPQEQRFMAAAQALAPAARDVADVLRRLDGWFCRLRRDLEAHTLSWPGLREDSPPAREAQAINTALRAVVQAWDRSQSDLARAQALAERFDERITLLVFGKFNAGKSAFCNLLAERYADQGGAVRCFHVEDGRIVDAPGRFVEGATEATARLQGVYLGDRLVLLDTPGLHSVTAQNAALTRRFTDSADGVLWLTSSTSPGQVQELDELARELHRNKPLLPVVTRSDVFEEDELDGDIVKMLRNKSAQNRALQEEDVRERARAKLRALGVDASLLRTPVSVSAHMAREQGLTPATLADAGFDRLYEALCAIVEPVLAYRQRKSAEMRLHHLEENVLGALQAEVLPRLERLHAALASAHARLASTRSRIAAALWRGVAPALPGMLKRHAEAGDVPAVCAALSVRMAEVRACAVDEMLGAEYVRDRDRSAPDIALRLEPGAGYERITVDADPAGAEPVETSGRHLVGVSHERLHAALQSALQDAATRLAEAAVEPARACLLRLRESAERLRCLVQNGERELHEVKRELREQG